MQKNGNYNHSIRLLKTLSAPVLVCLLGFFVAWFAFHSLSKTEKSTFKKEFQAVSKERFKAVESTLSEAQMILLSLKGLYDVSNSVNRDEFTDYVLPWLDKKGFIKSFEWIPKVRSGQRLKYEQEARREGMENFQITVKNKQGEMIRAPEKEVYFPIYYIEPFTGNQPALGYDLSSEPKYENALKRSLDIGGSLASGPLRFVQGERNGEAFVLFRPVFRAGAINFTKMGRKQGLAGYLAIVITYHDLLHAALSELKDFPLSFYLFDSANESGTAAFVAAYNQAKQNFDHSLGDKVFVDQVIPFQSSDLPYKSKNISFAGRHWEMLSVAHKDFGSGYFSNLPWIVAFIISGISIFFSLFLWQQIRARYVIQEEVKKRTAELEASKNRTHKIMESVQVGLVIIEAENKTIVEANSTACQLIGAKPEELIGKVCHDYICPAEIGQCPILDLGQEIDISERVVLTVEGKELPVLKTAVLLTLEGKDYLLENFMDIQTSR